MNKVIDTSTRLFLAIVGPLGFWKNRADIQIVERKNILSQISKSPILLQRDSASL